MKVLLVGNSHVSALEWAFKKHFQDSSFTMDFLRLHESIFLPNVVEEDGRSQLNVNIRQKIKNEIQPDLIVSCVGGNFHNTAGLLNHNVPFDFVLKDSPVEVIKENRMILPYELIRRIFELHIRPNILDIINLLNEYSKYPIVHIESPPPIAQEEHILKYPGGWKDKVAQYGVAPPSIRYKLWRLHSNIIEDFCREKGFVFCPISPTTTDEDGFMRAEFMSNDPTHGSGPYGVEQLKVFSEVIGKIKI